MQIDDVTGWEEFLEREAGHATILVADPSGEPIDRYVDRYADQLRGDTPVMLAVGPEGGFTETELQQAASAGAQLVNLGPHVLRIETAAIALAAYFSLGHVSETPSD